MNVVRIRRFKWTAQREAVAVGLAEGKSQEELSSDYNLSTRQIRRWLADVEFSTEVDRLSMMIGIASRAERLRLANRVIRQKLQNDVIETDKDLLDWLKYAQTETDGIRLDLDSTFDEVISSLAGNRQEVHDAKNSAA